MLILKNFDGVEGPLVGMAGGTPLRSDPLHSQPMPDDHTFSYRLEANDGAARVGTFTTPHGDVPTPAFMPVGTLGTVKALSMEEVGGLGARMVLGNTYHLYLRPGHDLVRQLGGLHDFMRWQGPILTDSGGYQVFSLAEIRDVTDEGAVFRSHVDGSKHLFTPESVMEIQRILGADVIMAFDECPPGGSDHAHAREANERTLRWLVRCRRRFEELDDEGEYPAQTLFPVLQGNIYDDLRLEHARQFQDVGDWAGFGIGGLSVGEAGHVAYPRVVGRGASHRRAPLPHGGGVPRRPPRGRGPGVRPLRLRGAHAQRPSRHCLDERGRPGQLEGVTLPRGYPAAGSEL